MNCIEPTQLKTDRLISQYRNSPILRAFIQVYKDEILECRDALNKLAIVFCVEKAEGDWLDLLGDIVGVSRWVPGGLFSEHFGFDTVPNSLPFNEGRWLSLNEAETGPRKMIDEEYRFAIRAQIARNYYDGTINSTIKVFSLIFNARVKVEDLSNDYRVIVYKEFTDIETAFISTTEIIPTVAGFSLNLVSEIPSDESDFTYEFTEEFF